MQLSLMRSCAEERKLRIFYNVVIVIVLATLVISLLTAAVLLAAHGLPETRVFASLIFFCVRFHNDARRLHGRYVNLIQR
jgi:hypothetical protein